MKIQLHTNEVTSNSALHLQVLHQYIFVVPKLSTRKEGNEESSCLARNSAGEGNPEQMAGLCCQTHRSAQSTTPAPPTPSLGCLT